MEDFRYYLDGPGEILVMAAGFDPGTPDVKKLYSIITAKTASFRGTTTQEKITGGRSLAPRRKILTDKEIIFELEDCEMDFRYLSLTQGEDIVTGVTTAYVFGNEGKHEINATTGKVTLAQTPKAGTLVVQFVEGTLATESVTVATAGTYSILAKELTFHTSDRGKVIQCTYQFDTEATTQTVSTKADSIPKTVFMVHKQPAFDQDNNIIGFQYIEIFKAQVGGEFEEAYAEKQPFAPKLTFEVLDSGRPDKKLVDHKYVPVSA